MSDTKFVDGDGKPIVLIELHREKAGWKPFSVICQNDKHSNQYDFDWCEKPKVLCFHNSGSGPRGGNVTLYPFVSPENMPGRIWHDSSIKLVDHDGKELQDESLKALGYVRLKRRPENPFDGWGVEDESTEYCTICESRFLTNGLCTHIRWCDEACWYAGCGLSETSIRDSQASLYQLLQVCPPSFVDDAIKRMRKGAFECGLWEDDEELRCGEKWDYTTIDLSQLYDEHNGRQRYTDAVNWLCTLDKYSTEANALTLGWFWQFQRERWSNHCVIGNLTFIRSLDDTEMDRWLAIDPHSVELPPLRLRRTFKADCANDIQFMESPKGTVDVTLWAKKGNRSERSVNLSVAEVRVGKKEVELVFGRILERAGKHVSELPGYGICKLAEAR